MGGEGMRSYNFLDTEFLFGEDENVLGIVVIVAQRYGCN